MPCGKSQGFFCNDVLGKRGNLEGLKSLYV